MNNNRLNIALVGDFKPEVTAHIAIPKALSLNADYIGRDLVYQWLPTIDLNGQFEQTLKSFDGMWCVPASPYADMQGALGAIRFARENRLPFLGTCGGYQHAALEYARNVLGYENADNAEVDADATMPLIAPLVCALIEAEDSIELTSGSFIEKVYGKSQIAEKYHCSYGVNAEYLSIFKNSNLVFTGFDQNQDPRVLEVVNHPFFIGTAYQPERSALKNQTHPLISEFLRACDR